jgi:hypothetical protein
VLVLWEGIEMKSVEDLDVFKLAHQLALKIHDHGNSPVTITSFLIHDDEHVFWPSHEHGFSPNTTHEHGPSYYPSHIGKMPEIS